MITAILLDWRPEYLACQQEATSLLLAPLGTGTLLEHIREQIHAADVHTLTIIPNFTWDEAYRDAIRELAPDVGTASRTSFGDFLESHEPADLLLIVDARHVPAAGFEFRVLLRDAANCRLTKHLIQLDHSDGGTRERVVCDDEMRVRGIQRLYDGFTQLDTRGVSASVVSVAVARHIGQPDLFCLRDLRAHLAAQGVPTRDITATGPAIDLSEAAGLLALNEHFVTGLFDGHQSAGFYQTGARVWRGRHCNVAQTARLYGPLIIHDDVVIEAGATVVGPCVLGCGTRIGRNAVVAQSVLGAGTEVAEGDSVGHALRLNGTIHVNTVSRQGEVPGLAATLPRMRQPERPSLRAWLRPRHPTPQAYEYVKRALDFTAALAGLLLLTPLMLVVALLIKLTSAGPVFFGHDREGRGGRAFRCWKFRTMVADAHHQQRKLYKQNQVDGPQFKMDRDPRITLVGNWLRKTNIDELPQLWNVVRGDMSLIGPRPSPFRENQICVPWREARLSVRPGITGLWQICRHERAAGDFHQWIFFDILYVRHVSWWLDLRILLGTAFTLGGRTSVPLTWMIPPRKSWSWQISPPPRYPEQSATHSLAPATEHSTAAVS